MTREEALARAHEALGCIPSGDPPAWCVEHGGDWDFGPEPCQVSGLVADLLLSVAREERAAALDEAADECRAERRWQTDRERRHLPRDDVKARMFVLEILLRGRAKRIREEGR